jgi:hypothetical protein
MSNDTPWWRRPGVRLRHDAHMWIRHDAARFVRPGFDPADVFPTLARKAQPVQAPTFDDELAAEIEAERRALDAINAELNEVNAEMARRRLAEEAKYRPDQPRIPKRNPGGGQWTRVGSGSGQSPPTSVAKPMGNVGVGNVTGSSELTGLFNIKPADPNSGNRSNSIVKVASDESGRRYHPDLTQEEARGGHTFRDHSEKTGEELLEGTTLVRGRAGIYRYARKRWGSFESREAATELVHRTLEQNRDQVDAVATGQLKEVFITAQFGFKTGQEAFRPNIDAKPYLRDTYGVGVFIEHDRRAERGYSVITAFPRND